MAQVDNTWQMVWQELYARTFMIGPQQRSVRQCMEMGKPAKID
jgi:hypothetical protein